MSLQICPDCGKELPPGLPEGICPNCLLKLGTTPTAAKPVKTDPPVTGENPGSNIGRYRLLEPIGEGGFGTVWLAEQQEPVRRKVALKIIKLGMDTKEVVARFEAERQALALMEHPNIARVFDGGATESGRPFIVMELVKGVRITDYCDAQQLSTEERLKLFMAVCQAVQHAHQKGIIHRDLKPSNVLVTEQDGHTVPKVIDFGIAKATEQALTARTFFTRFNQLIGTPAYMSPEQAGLGSLDVDTRSDIYSLGVLLYELLTGRTPFANEELLKAGLDQVLRIIREKEPPKPSTQLSTLTVADLLAIAQRRGVEPRKLNHLVRGDLDWIVMKCLEKDRGRRYDTANGLARDIERHLNNEAVVAAAPNLGYQFQKLLRRNRVLFTAIGAVLTALLFGLALSTWLFFKERQTRQRAEVAERDQSRLRKDAQTEAVKSRQIADFLKNMLQGVRPQVAMGRDTTMLREITDRTVDGLGEALKDQPAIEAELRNILGIVYRELLEWPKAESMHRQGLAAARKLEGADDRLVTQLLLTLADTLRFEGKFNEAEPLYREGLSLRKGLANPADFPELYNGFAEILRQQRKFSEAEAVMHEALEIWRKNPSSAGLPRTLAAIADRLCDEERFAEAEATAREGLKHCHQYHPHDRGLLSWLAGTLGYACAQQGNWPSAEAAFRESIANSGGGNERDLSRFGWYDDVGRVLIAQGKFAEAEALMMEFVKAYREVVGKYTVSGDLFLVFPRLANLLRDQGKTLEDEALLTEVVATYPKALQTSPVTGDWVMSLAILGDALIDRERWTDAEKVCRDGLTFCREKQPNRALRRQQLARGVALALQRQEKWAEAETFYREAITYAAQNWPNESAKYDMMFKDLSEVLQRQGKPVNLERLRTELAAPAAQKP